VTDECSNLLLNDYAAMTKSVSMQLLEVRHLTSPEKYIGFPKLVFIITLDEVGQNFVKCGCHVVALYFLIFTQNSIPMEEIHIRASGWEASSTDAYCF
jgi:hypothetical protein